MRRALHWAGIALAALSLLYVGRSLIEHLPAVLELDRGWRTCAVVVMATVLSGCILGLLAASWAVLAFAGWPPRPALSHAVRIYALSGIAKYLPGNIFHLVGRQVLGRRLQVSQGRLAVATAAEIAFSLLSVWLIVTAVFSVLAGPISPRLSIGGLLLGALATIAVTSPDLIRRTMARRVPLVGRLLGDAGRQDLALALALNFSYFLCLAVIGGAVSGAVTGAQLPLMHVGAVYLGAWLVGYVVPGASAGFGVREAALLAHLGGALGEPGALAFALAMRLQSILADVLFFGASFALPREAVEEVVP